MSHALPFLIGMLIGAVLIIWAELVDRGNKR